MDKQQPRPNSKSGMKKINNVDISFIDEQRKQFDKLYKQALSFILTQEDKSLRVQGILALKSLINSPFGFYFQDEKVLHKLLTLDEMQSEEMGVNIDQALQSLIEMCRHPLNHDIRNFILSNDSLFNTIVGKVFSTFEKKGFF